MSSNPPQLPPRRPYRRWVNRLVLFGACVVGVEGLVGDQGLSQALRARREFDRASAELSALQNRNERLRQETVRLKSDLRSIEEIARRELGLVRRGEILVILKDQSTSQPK